jgi:hypothetical protein
MKKLLLTLAALPAATMAVEASAQTYVNNNASVTIQNQIVQLQSQLDNGVRAGAVDATEARRLRQDIRQLNRLQRQYSAGGLTTVEWNALQQRVGTLNQQLQMAANGYGNQPYGNAYGYNQQQQGYYGQQQGYYANNGNAYGNNGVAYDQYGRPVANGYYGQGGPYVPAPRSNGIGNVLGGVLGNVVGGGGGGAGGILGSILGNGGLNVGTVITSVLGSALGNVPSNYSNQYQGNGQTYFRTDGQRVYEIDARTNTVVRVHPYR